MTLDISREEFYEFIKVKGDDEHISSRTAHYMAYFDKYSATKIKKNWNESAFKGPAWMFYRKMYVKGMVISNLTLSLPFILFGLFIINYSVTSHMAKLYIPTMLVLPTIVDCYILGAYGDYLYLCFARKKIKAGVVNSGVNLWGAISLSLLNFIMCILAVPLVMIIAKKFRSII